MSTWDKLEEFVAEWTANQVEFYSERYPHTWEEVFNDADKSLTKALLAEEKFIDLMHKHLNELKREV